MISPLVTVGSLLLIAYAPGALAYRLPGNDREQRRTLHAEERIFWQVILSLAWSLGVMLALAAAGVYSFARLLVINALGCSVVLAMFRGRLLWRGQASRATVSVIAPIVLVSVGLW